MIEDIFKPVRLGSMEITWLSDNFIKSCECKSTSTLLTYRRSLDCFLSYYKSNDSFSFGVVDIEHYKQYLQTVKGLKNASVKTYLTALRKFCSYLTAQGVIEKNPAKRVSCRGEKKNDEPLLLAEEEINILMKSITGTDPVSIRDEAMIRLILETCCSEFEIRDAQYGDIFIYRKKWYFKLKKQGSEDLIWKKQLSLQTVESILSYRDLLGTDLKENEPLFRSFSRRSDGKRLTIRGIRNILKQRLLSSGLMKYGESLPPSIIRKTAIRLIVQSGKEISNITR